HKADHIGTPLTVAYQVNASGNLIFYRALDGALGRQVIRRVATNGSGEQRDVVPMGHRLLLQLFGPRFRFLSSTTLARKVLPFLRRGCEATCALARDLTRCIKLLYSMG